jgi:hypothetical protein
MHRRRVVVVSKHLLLLFLVQVGPGGDDLMQPAILVVVPPGRAQLVDGQALGDAGLAQTAVTHATQWEEKWQVALTERTAMTIRWQ